jgi:hypothetical protein
MSAGDSIEQKRPLPLRGGAKAVTIGEGCGTLRKKWLPSPNAPSERIDVSIQRGAFSVCDDRHT